MPQLIEVPGMGNVEFPDGMSDAQISSAIQKNMASSQSNIGKTNALQGGAKVPIFDSIKTIGDWMAPGGFDRKMVGLGRGFTDVSEGIKQKYLQGKELLGFGNKGDADKYQKNVDQERKFYQEQMPQYSQSSDAQFTRFAAQTAPYMAIPGGVQGSILRKMLTGALSGATTGALQYVPEGGSALTNTLLGTALGSAAPLLMKALTKGYNTIEGNYADPAQEALIKLGKQHNVPVYAPDISNSRVIQGGGRALEEVPIIGMQGERKAQMIAAKNAAQNVVSQSKGAMDDTAFGGLTGLRRINEAAGKGNNAVQKNADDILNKLGIFGEDRTPLLQKAGLNASTNSNRAQAARNLLDEMKNSGDDWNRIMQTSGNVKLFRSKLIADKKYNKVAEMADKYGAVDTSNIYKAVNRMLGSESEGVLKNEGLMGLLGKVKKGLVEEVPAVPGSSLLDSMGKPIVQGQESKIALKGLNYSQLIKFRSDLSDEISDYFTGANAAIGKKGIGALKALKQQIDNSLNNFSQIHGSELKTVWKNADNFYGNFVAPAKDKLLANALKNANPDEVYGKFIGIGARESGKGTGRAQSFYNALDNKGKAAVKYGMVSDAFEKAYKGDVNQFSPAQFASDLDRHAAAKGVFFKGADKVEIDGFKNLMRHVERSYQAVNKPDTGVRNIPYMILGGAGFGASVAPTTTAGLAATTYGIKKLFTTEAGKRFLFSASTLKPGSEGIQKAAQVLQKIFQQSAVLGATQPSN